MLGWTIMPQNVVVSGRKHPCWISQCENPVWLVLIILLWYLDWGEYLMTYEEIKRRIMACQASELDLSDCDLVDDDVSKMVIIINQYNRITTINFSYNNLSSAVFESLLQLRNVKELNLANNNINRIDEQLMTPGKFIAINLRSNNIPASSLEHFLKAYNHQCAGVQFGFEGNPNWKSSSAKASSFV